MFTVVGAAFTGVGAAFTGVGAAFTVGGAAFTVGGATQNCFDKIIVLIMKEEYSDEKKYLNIPI